MPHVMTLRPGGTAFVPTDQKLDDLKLINYDMDKYGSTDVRKALINKWVSEVKMGK